MPEGEEVLPVQAEVSRGSPSVIGSANELANFLRERGFQVEISTFAKREKDGLVDGLKIATENTRDGRRLTVALASALSREGRPRDLFEAVNIAQRTDGGSDSGAKTFPVPGLSLNYEQFSPRVTFEGPVMTFAVSLLKGAHTTKGGHVDLALLLNNISQTLAAGAPQIPPR